MSWNTEKPVRYDWIKRGRNILHTIQRISDGNHTNPWPWSWQ